MEKRPKRMETWLGYVGEELLEERKENKVFVFSGKNDETQDRMKRDSDRRGKVRALEKAL